MRTLLVLLLSVSLTAQQDSGLMSTMKSMSTAVTRIDRAIATGDRDALTDPLAELRRALPQLRAATVRAPAAANAAIDDLETAILDLGSPVDDGKASDPWDLARVRRACTECHLQNRSDVDGRGMFPNHQSLVTGTLTLTELEGRPREDRSGVVVFLEQPGLPTTPMPRKPSISQQGRRFTPAVLAVTPGTTVRFPNDDVVFHNVFSLSRGNAFDLGIYGKGVEQERVLAQPGLVKVHCNIHPDMAADVLVLATPYAAITRADGFWAITDVPAGDYTLRSWHPFAEELRLPLRVDDDATASVPLVVRETRPRVQHPNKHGRGYDRKY